MVLVSRKFPQRHKSDWDYYRTSRRYNPISRYHHLRKFTDEKGRQFRETQDEIRIPETDEDIDYVVPAKYEHRIDLVAAEFYPSHKYYWIIAVANNIHFPFVLPTGTVLRIPPFSVVYDRGGLLRIN